MGAWMGKSEQSRAANLSPKSNQIQVEWARLVQHQLRLSSKRRFSGFEFLQQRFRCFGRKRNESGHCIRKKRRTGRTINRCALPDGGTQDTLAGKVLELQERAFHRPH